MNGIIKADNTIEACKMKMATGVEAAEMSGMVQISRSGHTKKSSFGLTTLPTRFLVTVIRTTMVFTNVARFQQSTRVYVIVPEKNRSEKHHYVFNETLYPKAGMRVFLPWEEALEETFIYTTKELKIIEQAITWWANDSEDSIHTCLREKLGGSCIAKVSVDDC